MLDSSDLDSGDLGSSDLDSSSLDGCLESGHLAPAGVRRPMRRAGEFGWTSALGAVPFV